jgi:hypothetical protein
MPTLVVSTWSLPAARALGEVARRGGWEAFAHDETPDRKAKGQVVYYGGTDLAMTIAARFGLALLEPPLDLLARLPLEFRRRTVEYARFGDLVRLRAPTFVKPADALNKSFDAGVYSSIHDIRAPRGVDPRNPVLLSEPVEWSAEYRCFILEGVLAAWSPYISFGRPAWKPFAAGSLAKEVPATVASLCRRLFDRPRLAFPPALVMDVGLIDDRGWAVVEFNPVWCSGLLGADPRAALPVLERACRHEAELSADDREWRQER